MNRIADGKLPGIDEPEDVAGICDLDGFAVAAEKAIRARSPQLLAHAAVGQHHVLFEAPRTHTHERDAIAMARVHVRLNLEDEAREPLVGGATMPDRPASAMAKGPAR